MKKRRNTHLLSLVKSFLVEEEGQDMVEYSLLLAFIAIAAIALLIGVQGSIKSLWTTVNTSLSSANSTAKSGAS